MEISGINSALNAKEIKGNKDMAQVSCGQSFVESFKELVLRTDRVVRGNETYAAGMSKNKAEDDWKKDPKIKEEEDCINDIFKRLAKIKEILKDKSS
ncbi:hypothetical protein A2230_05095 [candidate division WOR-1 bacterium RIFOXYA2_FULL_36_21]|uniref:Uncharacterized protein n=1 Tax=candidate division WOR-1 bacterium RIFOXYB2_FULL_36_35 TaxID=1802578 RepID=A0A1F4S5U5_UNCSA|nr:MAG: hypothetical protein A2230_05095 [candidate division WOR-1 bacterium RIFOXYA2_FULL_36_21]OGC15780.1 MAG: hypothetical protein A2290_05520 [candidate division WOR-1 bacterium RIFOXYB2_FULL_36_35]OGC18976.1 MAG: hypothetical protein A2282_09290 [candidate division WOR-1 bacterium RIFOXYA12_FULL_36_13]